MYYVCFQLNCHFHQSTSSTRRVRADASSLKRQGSVITGELDTPRALFRALTPLMCVIHWSGVRDWGQDKITRKLTNPWHEFPCQISRDPRGVHERKYGFGTTSTRCFHGHIAPRLHSHSPYRRQNQLGNSSEGESYLACYTVLVVPGNDRERRPRGARSREGRGGAHFMQSRSYMTIDPRIPTTPGRSTSEIHRPGKHCVALPSAQEFCFCDRTEG